MMLILLILVPKKAGNELFHNQVMNLSQLKMPFGTSEPLLCMIENETGKVSDEM